MRFTYKKPEITKKILKTLMYSEEFKFIYKMYFVYKFNEFSKTTAISKYSRYCMMSYTGKAVYKHFKLGRHMFKKMASEGYLGGIRKSAF